MAFLGTVVLILCIDLGYLLFSLVVSYRALFINKFWDCLNRHLVIESQRVTLTSPKGANATNPPNTSCFCTLLESNIGLDRAV